jgi:hypothetical protein
MGCGLWTKEHIGRKLSQQKAVPYINKNSSVPVGSYQGKHLETLVCLGHMQSLQHSVLRACARLRARKAAQDKTTLTPTLRKVNLCHIQITS